MIYITRFLIYKCSVICSRNYKISVFRIINIKFEVFRTTLSTRQELSSRTCVFIRWEIIEALTNLYIILFLPLQFIPSNVVLKSKRVVINKTKFIDSKTSIICFPAGFIVLSMNEESEIYK